MITTGREPKKFWLIFLLSISTLSFLTIGIFLALEVKRQGGVFFAIESLSGKHILAINSHITVKFSAPGEKKRIAFELRNLTDKPVNILGSMCSCTCMVVAGLPAKIDPFGSRTIDVNAIGTKEETFEGELELYTDDPEKKIVPLAFTGLLARKR